jgi:hypothetical protein
LGSFFELLPVKKTAIEREKTRRARRKAKRRSIQLLKALGKSGGGNENQAVVDGLIQHNSERLRAVGDRITAVLTTLL